MNSYRRLEFVFDIGEGPRVLAFVDFSSHISFGIPKSFQFLDFKPASPSENYERITVHNDGTIKTHLPFGNNITPLWDGKKMPLAKWDEPWTMLEELYWGPDNQSIKECLTKPKNVKTSTKTQQEIVRFPDEILATQIGFSLFKSLSVPMSVINKIAPEIQSPNFCTWVLTDSWPIILISIRIPNTAKVCINLNSVGRDYRI